MTLEQDPLNNYQPPSQKHLQEIFEKALEQVTGGEPEAKQEIRHNLNVIAGFHYLSQGFNWLSGLLNPKRKS